MSGTTGSRVQATKRARRFVVGGKFVAADNETRKIFIASRPCKVIAATIEPEAALGASLGVDIVNGGSGGTGTDVMGSGADNQSATEDVTITANNEMADGGYLNVTFDNYATPTDVSVHVTIEEYGG